MPMQYADNQARILSYTNQLKYPKKMYDRVGLIFISELS